MMFRFMPKTKIKLRSTYPMHMTVSSEKWSKIYIFFENAFMCFCHPIKYKIYNLARRLCLVPRCCPYYLHNYIYTLKYNICRLVSLNVNSTVPALYTIKEIQSLFAQKLFVFNVIIF